MKKQTITLSSVIVIIAILLSACSPQQSSSINQSVGQALNNLGISKWIGQTAEQLHLQLQSGTTNSTNTTQNQPVAIASTAAPAISAPAGASPVSNALIAAYEGTLESIYATVNPQVVNIRVLIPASSASDQFQTNPFNLPNNNQNQPQTPQYGEALGSGFVWDTQGHIVTNNHVVDQAEKVEVTFSDGTTVPATIVGQDPYSDLAVIQVNVDPAMLHPVTLADSKQAQVGQLAVAIGNPYGLENTMTVGIISALGRSLPADQVQTGTTATYSIPDVIQTDAAINPGNSGGVLVDAQGNVVGVTAAIESNSGSNSGIGFVIPSDIVQRVVPSLISTGSYSYPYLGITGTTLTPDLAQAMGLSSTQRGALVEEVVAGGPSDKAGLKASAKQVTINGQDVYVGGDVITAIDGQPIKQMDDVIAYLMENTQVGQKVTLTVLRDGSEKTLEVTLGQRPTSGQASSSNNNTPTNPTGNAYLGIQGLTLTPEIASAMSLPDTQTGVLVEQVVSGSPADQVGLLAGSQTVTIQGQSILVGGDVITAIDGQSISTIAELKQYLANTTPDQQVTLTILRDGSEMTLQVTLTAR